MSRMIAILTGTGYRASYVTFDDGDLTDILNRTYTSDFAAHTLVNGGDVLALQGSSPMRSYNRMPSVPHPDLKALVKAAQANGVHHISIHDSGDRVLGEIAEWNLEHADDMTVDELFVENFTGLSPWRHILDGQSVFEVFTAAKAA